MSHLCFLAFKLNNPKNITFHKNHPESTHHSYCAGKLYRCCLHGFESNPGCKGEDEGVNLFPKQRVMYALKEQLLLSLNLSSSSNCKQSYS